MGSRRGADRPEGAPRSNVPACVGLSGWLKALSLVWVGIELGLCVTRGILVPSRMCPPVFPVLASVPMACPLGAGSPLPCEWSGCGKLGDSVS